MKHAMLAVVAILAVALGPSRAYAQSEHVDSPKVTVTVTQTLLVGTAILLPGDYKIQCQLLEGRTFLVVKSADRNKEIVRVPCEREILPGKVTETELRVITVGDGTQTLKSVRIKGESVAHRLLAS